MTEKIEPLPTKLGEPINGVRQVVIDFEAALAQRDATIDRAEREIARLREALEWYAPHLENCRKIHREGDDARQALAADRGQRARAALAKETK